VQLSVQHEVEEDKVRKTQAKVPKVTPIHLLHCSGGHSIRPNPAELAASLPRRRDRSGSGSTGISAPRMLQTRWWGMGNVDGEFNAGVDVDLSCSFSIFRG
jgi:hypothetical protein